MADVAEPGELIFAAGPDGQEELRRLTGGAQPFVVSRRAARRLLVDLPRIGRATAAAAVLATYTAPATRRPCVLAVHDVASWHPGAGEWLPLATRVRIRATVGASCRLATTVLALTEAARRDIIEHLGLVPEKVVVASAAVDAELADLLASTPRRPRAGELTLLAVGAVLPRKNLLVLGEAVRSLRDAGMPARLRVVGPVPEAGVAIASSLRRILGDALELTGYVSRPQLAVEYRSADVLCFPSVLEGFGIPVLEAMAAGTPVVVSDATSLPEVTSGAALVCPANDPAAWRDALVRLAEGPRLREQLVARGRRRVEDFSWSRTAATVLECLRGAGAGAGRIPTGSADNVGPQGALQESTPGERAR
jgi:glycosyltransferase involved in cell wall biosynthesis